MATYTENGIIYEDIDENTRRVVGYAQPGQPSGFVPPNARRVAEAEREAQRQAQADARAARSEARADRSEARASRPAPGEGLMWGPDGQSVTFIPGGVRDPSSPYYKGNGGKPMRQGDADKLSGQIDQYDLLKTSAMNFNPDFAGNSIGGELENWAQGLFGTGTPGQRDWWANFRSFDNLYRNELFGASLTEGEKQAYAATSVTPSMDPEQVRINVNRRAEIIRSSLERRADRLRAAGFNEDEIQASVGEFATDLGIDIPVSQSAPEFSVKQREDDPPAGALPQGPDRSNRAGVLFGQPPSDSQNGGFVPYGAETRLERNPQWKGVNEAVKGMIVAGRPAQEIKSFLSSKGIAGDAATGVEEALRYYQKTGKRDFGVDVENIQVPMSGFDQFRNNAPQTMVGTAAATALNAGGFGIPQMMAGGEGLDYLRQQNPGSAFAGDVAGVIGGTAALGKLGGNVAGRLAPSLLGGGGKAAAGRQLATDAAYGGIYGATTEGTPQGALIGALTAGLGSAGGQVIGTGIGKALKGASMSAPAQALKGMGVNNLTIGQMLGGKAKSLEDAMTSAPLIGDIVNARRGEGFQDFNLAALNQAGAPIGATVNETGENGINQLMGQVSRAYDNATSGVDVPLDAQFMADMQAASAAGQKLPPDYQVRFDKMGQNRIGPIVDAGAMTGDTYQQSMRGLKGARSSASQAAPGFEQDYRDAITLSMDALKGQMQRGGGQSVINGLAAADNSNRLGKTIEKAMGAARNGTRSGEIQVFTPSQLNDAAYAAQRKFPGPRPFAQLADAGQEVLPSQLPDSGTARRLTSIALPASLGGVGGGLGFTGGDPQTAMQGAGAGLTVGALLALGGSKAGQKALEAALFKRPKAVRRAGGIFGSRKGQQALSGLITAPLLIE